MTAAQLTTAQLIAAQLTTAQLTTAQLTRAQLTITAKKCWHTFSNFREIAESRPIYLIARLQLRVFMNYF